MIWYNVAANKKSTHAISTTRNFYQMAISCRSLFLGYDQVDNIVYG